MDKIEEIIFESMLKSYREKLRELPPPLPGYWYKPEVVACHVEGGKYVMDMTITMEPIMEELG